MKSNYKKLSLFLLLITAFSLGACQKNSPGVIDSKEIESQNSIETLVSKESAMKVAETYANNYASKHINENTALNAKSTGKKKVSDVLTLKDSKEREILYLINYEEGGFAIVPADQRMNPILAYSETTALPKKREDILSGGLNIWLKLTINSIEQTRDAKSKSTNVKKKNYGWNILTSPNQVIIDPGECPDHFEQVGPLLQTKWGQANGYNLDTPNMQCGQILNGRALTGCVATAMAQIMRYHEHPNNYNWSIMPNGPISTATFNYPSGTSELAELMSDAGISVGMDYGCDESLATTSDAEAAFENDFNYSTSVDYQGYDTDDIVYELQQNRPVLLRGQDPSYGGHAWVAEGFRRDTIWNEDCTEGWGYLIFYMNWGFNGNYNGWFSFDNFDPHVWNFDTAVHQIIRIKP